MKRTLRIAAFTFALLVLAAIAHGQTVVSNVPQSVQMRIFNAVNTAQCGNVTQNIGQNVHMVSIRVDAGAARVRLQLEASNDGTNFFPISAQDATVFTQISPGASNVGAVYGFGFFPVLRACILEFNIAAAAPTLTAHYSGTSSTQRPEGQFNPAQNNYRTMAFAADAATSITRSVVAPFGNTAGILTFEPSAALPAGTCTLQVTAVYGVNTGLSVLPLTNLATTGVQHFFIPAHPATSVSVEYTNCGATAVTYSLSYVFFAPTLPLVNTTGRAAGATSFLTEAEFACTQSRAFNLAGASTTEIIPLVAGQTIRVCHISFSLSAADDVTLVQGTGAACAGTPANLSGLYDNTTGLNLNFGPGAAIRTTASFAVCVTVAGAATGGGVVSFARF